jgi:EAL domain-containing protein (putative c-di-GMP-specific phosphodiesterase class I)
MAPMASCWCCSCRKPRCSRTCARPRLSTGVRVGLEQFGSGLNSFQLLTHFDADLLKLDRTFMQDLATNPDHQRRIQELAGKAHELGKQVIIDHVQDAASLSILFAAGIDYAEGNFLAAASAQLDYDFQ